MDFVHLDGIFVMFPPPANPADGRGNSVK